MIIILLSIIVIIIIFVLSINWYLNCTFTYCIYHGNSWLKKWTLQLLLYVPSLILKCCSRRFLSPATNIRFAPHPQGQNNLLFLLFSLRFFNLSGIFIWCPLITVYMDSIPMYFPSHIATVLWAICRSPILVLSNQKLFLLSWLYHAI